MLRIQIPRVGLQVPLSQQLLTRGKGVRRLHCFSSTSSSNQQQQHSQYEIKIVTGDKRGASTNANVFLSIFDSEDNEYHVPVDPTASFERNTTTTLLLDNSNVKNINDVSKIRVGHDGSETGSGWYLDSIVIHDPRGDNNKETVKFLLQEWLGKSDSGGTSGPATRELGSSNKDTHHIEEMFDINALPLKSPYLLDHAGFCIPHPEKVKEGEGRKAVCKNAYG